MAADQRHPANHSGCVRSGPRTREPAFHQHPGRAGGTTGQLYLGLRGFSALGVPADLRNVRRIGEALALGRGVIDYSRPDAHSITRWLVEGISAGRPAVRDRFGAVGITAETHAL